MKALLINGSPRKDGCTNRALEEIIATLNKEGIDTELFWIGNKPVPGCTACGFCIANGKCIYDDNVNSIGSRLDEFDAIVVGSPVYYGGPSGQIQSFLDRLFYTFGSKMDLKIGASVVSCRRGGATSSFDRLNKYFLMNNMIVAPSQYWNQVHGSKKEDVEKDEEGLQTMRALGENIVYILKCQAGAKIDKPIREKKIPTNFIK